MRLRILLFITICVINAGGAAAQASHKAVNQGDPAKAVQALVDRFDREFTNIAKEMPADKYEFTPATLNIPGSEFTKVRSFADEVKHVAQANFAIAANVGEGADPTREIAAVGKLKLKSEILAALEKSFVAVRLAIATITPANENDIIDDSGVAPN